MTLRIPGEINRTKVETRVITTRGDLIRGDSVGVAERLGLGDLGQVIGSATDLLWVDEALPRAHISGLILSQDTDTDHDVNITAGACRSFDNSVNLVLPTEQTKQIDTPWATGNDAGGIATQATVTSATQDTWYHVHALGFSTATGMRTEIGFDVSVSATNLFTGNGATQYRRLGSVLTDSSANIISWAQDEDTFLWNVPISEKVDNDPGTSAITETLTTPLGVKVQARITFSVDDQSPGAQTHGLVTSLEIADTAPSSTLYHARITDSSSAERKVDSVFLDIRTSVASAIRWRMDNSDTGVTTSIICHGWVEDRERV